MDLDYPDVRPGLGASIEDDYADVRTGLGYGLSSSNAAGEPGSIPRFVRAGEADTAATSKETLEVNPGCDQIKSDNPALANPIRPHNHAVPSVDDDKRGQQNSSSHGTFKAVTGETAMCTEEAVTAAGVKSRIARDAACSDKPTTVTGEVSNAVGDICPEAATSADALGASAGNTISSSSDHKTSEECVTVASDSSTGASALDCKASSGSGGEEKSCTANSNGEAEGALSPLEIEQRKLAAFEEKLKMFDRQREDVKTPLPQQPLAQLQNSTCNSGDVDIEEVNSRSVCVFGLDAACTPDDLQNLFQASGPINRVTIVVDKMTGMPKGFAYIEFKDGHGVQNALLLNGTMLREYPLKVTQKLTNIKGKAKDKGKSKDKGKNLDHVKGMAFDARKGKGKDYKTGKGKGKAKFYGNMVYRPSNTGPY